MHPQQPDGQMRGIATSQRPGHTYEKALLTDFQVLDQQLNMALMSSAKSPFRSAVAIP